MVRFSSLALLFLAACPAKQPPPTNPQQPATAGVGCPKASDVYIAQYARADQTAQGAQSFTGWTLPLFTKKVDTLEGVAQFATIDAAAAQTIGVPPAPTTVWLQPSNGPLCKATVGGFYAEAVDGPVKNISYGAVLAGCGAPQNPDDDIAIAMVSVEQPSQCTPLPPALAAARLSDRQGAGPDPSGVAAAWTRPTKETPIPPDVAPLIPAHACTAPACEKLWSIGKIDVGGKTVAYAGAVNWLDTTTGSDPCAWKTETFSGFFVPTAEGTFVKVTEGQDHPLGLAVALVDATGAKVLIADGNGEYATYDATPAGATLGRHVTYFIDDPTLYGETDRLGPSCAAPAH
ncbi:MAG TPA: hypothetical protein VGM90_21495 [Kofleriaceae bacterium]|jgi:hypothetical protein